MIRPRDVRQLPPQRSPARASAGVKVESPDMTARGGALLAARAGWSSTLAGRGTRRERVVTPFYNQFPIIIYLFSSFIFPFVLYFDSVVVYVCFVLFSNAYVAFIRKVHSTYSQLFTSRFIPERIIIKTRNHSAFFAILTTRQNYYILFISQG